MSALEAPAVASAPSAGALGARIAYGALGLPLAFVALPLYVLLPEHYASRYGVPLAALGAVLLAARLADAVIDPLVGRYVDALFARGAGVAWRGAAAGAAVLAVGLPALFFPPVEGTPARLAWCGLALVATYAAYSLVSVVHQAWGARLGGDAAERARIVAWREGLALAGVLLASVLPSLAGPLAMVIAFAALLAVGLALLARAPVPPPGAKDAAAAVPFALALGTPAFRWLLAVYLANGLASALPATLVLFFVADRLEAPALAPLFLVAYFAAGALAMPLWPRLVERLGLERTWLASMALALVSFAGAGQLQRGDSTAFALVCLASGLALGADLCLPPALLAGVVRRAGHGGRAEGSYFGWWNFATKLNLALAAGLALPLLQALGYAPGRRDAAALAALGIAYAVLPCVLKLAAAGLLLFTWRRRCFADGPG